MKINKGIKNLKDHHWADLVFSRILIGCSSFLPFTFFFIVLFLFRASHLSLYKFGLCFLITSIWDPVREIFGALPVIYGTVFSSLLALLISVPISIGVGLLLTELAPEFLAGLLGFLVEMLAAIPSVVYGLWGIFVLTPWLRHSVEPFLSRFLGFLPFFQGPAYGVGMLAAGIILAIMITPTVCSITREVFLSIPRVQREAAIAIGATKWETMNLAVLKSSKLGIFGAATLGLGRALGETMAVTMVIGNRAAISASLFSPSQTMSSVIANEYAEATTDIHLSALVEIGLALFIVTFLVNGVARIIVWRTTSRQNF